MFYVLLEGPCFVCFLQYTDTLSITCPPWTFRINIMLPPRKSLKPVDIEGWRQRGSKGWLLVPSIAVTYCATVLPAPCRAPPGHWSQRACSVHGCQVQWGLDLWKNCSWGSLATKGLLLSLSILLLPRNTSSYCSPFWKLLWKLSLLPLWHCLLKLTVWMGQGLVTSSPPITSLNMSLPAKTDTLPPPSPLGCKYRRV